MRLCSVPDCGRPYVAKGFCKGHYIRFKKYGDALGGGPQLQMSPRGEAMQFIRETALPCVLDECLPWQFAKDSSGYGQVWSDGKLVPAHRLVCELANGPAHSVDLHAAHSCGNGHLGCVNPKHLSWKTVAENAADRIAHGTQTRGARHGTAKLTEEQAREILSLKGVRTQAEIAAIFGVRQTTVSKIHSGKRWAYMEGQSA